MAVGSGTASHSAHLRVLLIASSLRKYRSGLALRGGGVDKSSSPAFWASWEGDMLPATDHSISLMLTDTTLRRWPPVNCVLSWTDPATQSLAHRRGNCRLPWWALPRMQALGQWADWTERGRGWAGRPSSCSQIHSSHRYQIHLPPRPTPTGVSEGSGERPATVLA